MEKEGIIKKLIEIVQNNTYTDKMINAYSAISIGLLYKAI